MVDPWSEHRGEESFYVPRDEAFSEVKQKMFPANPGKKDKLGSKPFSDFTQIDLMFRDGIEIPPAPHEILRFNISSTLSTMHAPPFVDPSTVQPQPARLVKFPPPEGLKSESTPTYFFFFFFFFLGINGAYQTNAFSSQLLQIFPGDKFNWLSDSEFARQTLAGLNPYSIQLVKVNPLISLSLSLFL